MYMGNVNKNIIWILIISISIAILHFSSEKIYKDDLVLISGILQSKPIEKIYGGDVPRFNYFFTLNDFNYNFRLSGCAHKMLNKKKILNLNKGDSVSIYVEKENPISKNREVYSVSWNNIEMLSLTSYNNCRNRDRALLIIILIGLDFYLVYRFFVKRAKGK